MDEAHGKLIDRLRGLASRERAEQEKRYQKSKWEHWGVSLPKMDVAIRETLQGVPPRALLHLSARLWDEPVWDLKIVAARILARDIVPPTETLWRFVRVRMADLDGWAVADNLASVGSRCLLADPRRLDAVEAWVKSPHLWTRRASLVFTLPWTKEDRDPERTLGWAAALADDPEWFNQKAIGWWLRELSKHDARRVRRFLKDHGARLKGVARREASRYLT
ncbi:MAG TPA: DNA alkylation repair protein [Roseiarcus sp.]|nr:DNA alkylation repair protein [Roseiarcus sp.]